MPIERAAHRVQWLELMAKAVERAKPEPAAKSFGQQVRQAVAGDYRGYCCFEHIGNIPGESRRSQGGATNPRDGQNVNVRATRRREFIHRPGQLERTAAGRGHNEDRTFACEPWRSPDRLLIRHLADVVEDSSRRK